jgi:hypothetical protein
MDSILPRLSVLPFIPFLAACLVLALVVGIVRSVLRNRK